MQEGPPHWNCFTSTWQGMLSIGKWYKDKARREEILSRMQCLELPAPPLLAATDLPPACEQPSSPPTPSGPVHKFPEPQDTTGQARRIRRATAGWSYRLGSQVLCRVVPASLLTTSSTSTATSSTTTITVPLILCHLLWFHPSDPLLHWYVNLGYF